MPCTDERLLLRHDSINQAIFQLANICWSVSCAGILVVQGQIKSCTARLGSSPGSEVLIEAACYQKEKRGQSVVRIQYPNGEYDITIMVPRPPTKLQLAEAPAITFWIPNATAVVNGYMMTAEDTAAQLPAPRYSRNGHTLPMGTTEVLEPDSMPSFYHCHPLTKGNSTGPTTGLIDHHDRK